jgi:hypothetical protein
VKVLVRRNGLLRPSFQAVIHFDRGQSWESAIFADRDFAHRAGLLKLKELRKKLADSQARAR